MEKAVYNPKFEYFKEFINGKRIAVVGLGVSNVPMVKFLKELGGTIIGCDGKDEEKFDKELLSYFRENTENLYLGEDYLSHFDGIDIILKTPGIRPDKEEFIMAVNNGTQLTSEMEMFFSVCPCKIIAVTGSDGKTTTTTLISKILSKAGYGVHIGGNIGNPLLHDAETISPQDVVVVELSSFQLMNMKYSADISVITNLSPNHLDYHKDYDEYCDAKKNIFLHQTKEGKLVVNMNNERANLCALEAKGEVVKFSLTDVTEHGAYYKDGDIFYDGEFIMKASDIRIPGVHNIDNYLAAISAVYPMVSKEDIRYVARNFEGVKHRLEFVREYRGIKFYNDSIASSPSRTIAGLKSFDQKVVLIAGGKDKGIPYDDIGAPIKEHVKALVLIGATASKIRTAVESQLDDISSLPIVEATTYIQAVKYALSLSRDGDIVLLSPASTSFDMFKNFEERGNLYKSIVMSLGAEEIDL